MRDGWVPVVHAAECLNINGEPAGEDDEPLICPICEIDYAECPCPGPHQEDEFEYQEAGGRLWARLKGDSQG
jgi:hypothetical protein